MLFRKNMRTLAKIVSILITLSLISNFVKAWSYETHLFLCEEIYNGNEELRKMLDKKEFLRGCNAPDIEFKDQNYHNCYIAKECKYINVSNTKPGTLAYFTEINDCFNETYLSCPAISKFYESIQKAKSDKFSFYIGAATHYYSDAFVPLHQVTGEDYRNCHLSFEDKVNEKIINKELFWSVSQKCTFYFPCKATVKTIRKCNHNYTAEIKFSYTDMINVIINTDNAISKELNIKSGDYSYLLKRKPTGFFIALLNKILILLKNIFSYKQ